MFICQACSERPSTPCARAHAPALTPLRSAARRHWTASRSSSIFRPTDNRNLRVAIEPESWRFRNHPALADGSRSSPAFAPRARRAVRASLDTKRSRVFPAAIRRSQRHRQVSDRRGCGRPASRPRSPMGRTCPVRQGAKHLTALRLQSAVDRRGRPLMNLLRSWFHARGLGSWQPAVAYSCSSWSRRSWGSPSPHPSLI